MGLSPYEQKEWERLQHRKDDVLAKKALNLIPASARNQVSKVSGAVMQSTSAETAIAAYSGAANEFGKIIGGAASLSVSTQTVIKQFNRAGLEITAIEQVRDLDLETIDSIARLARIKWGHSGSAALTGFGSAAAITGGSVWFTKGTVHGAGAKKAPSIGVVATAYAADISAVLGIAARTVASTARYYGYDPQKREEQVFMMSVIGLGMATGGPAKTAAYAELSQLTQLLFKDATWAKLNEKVLTKVAQQFAGRFSVTLTKKKLGQFVPVAGMLIGAGLNFSLIDKIAAAADDAYRERHLVGKGAGTLGSALSQAAQNTPDVPLGVLELLASEDALPEPAHDDPDPGTQNP